MIWLLDGQVRNGIGMDGWVDGWVWNWGEWGVNSGFCME